MAERPTGRAGVHLDGNTATVVLLRSERAHPSLAEVHQTRGFGGPDALAAAVRLLPDGMPVRVTVSVPGIRTTLLAIGAAAPSRDEFTGLAHQAFGDLPADAAVAGVLGDPAQVPAGGMRAALAVAAPADTVADIYRSLAGRPWLEVTTCAVAAPWIDGLYLALRRGTSELTLVSGGQTVAARMLYASGLEDAHARLRGTAPTGAAPEANPGPDPQAGMMVRDWLAAVTTEVAHTIHEWELLGHRVDREVHVHGRYAGAAGLDDLLTAAGIARVPHPIGTLPHAEPLDAVDAYLAAVTFGHHMPYATFLPVSPATPLKQPATVGLPQPGPEPAADPTASAPVAVHAPVPAPAPAGGLSDRPTSLTPNPVIDVPAGGRTRGRRRAAAANPTGSTRRRSRGPLTYTAALAATGAVVSGLLLYSAHDLDGAVTDRDQVHADPATARTETALGLREAAEQLRERSSQRDLLTELGTGGPARAGR